MILESLDSSVSSRSPLPTGVPVINQSNALDLAALINIEHEGAYRKAREALDHARRAGGLLLQAKAIVGHGEWLPWITAHCKFSTRTAQGYMRLASRWNELQGKCATVAHLGIREALELVADAQDSNTSEYDAGPAGPDEPREELKAVDHDDVGHQVVDHQAVDHQAVDHQAVARDDVAHQPAGDDDETGQSSAPAHAAQAQRRLTRAERWADACAKAEAALQDLIEVQAEFQAWRESVPENVCGSATAEKLDAVDEIDIEGALHIIEKAGGIDLLLDYWRD